MSAALALAPPRPAAPYLATCRKPLGVDLWLFGCGNVGRALLSILAAQRDQIAFSEGVELCVRAITTTRGTWLDVPDLIARGPHGDPVLREPELALAVLARSPRAVLIDLSAAADVAPLYERALASGLGVVTANKLPLAGSAAELSSLRAQQRHGARFLYETTVGADLPVIAPIRDRVRSGDQIHAIEGSLSGTLGFVCEALSQGVPLDEAVTEARTRGLTEPDPLVDLAGLDVARKAVILARELGISIELGDVALEGLVPEDVLRAAPAQGLVPALRAFEPTLRAEVERQRARGLVLRYLARVDAMQRRATVGPVYIPLAHPAASLRGTESMVALHSQRCGERPIVIRGPGAGAEVTASGVLADVLRAARR